MHLYQLIFKLVSQTISVQKRKKKKQSVYWTVGNFPNNSADTKQSLVSLASYPTRAGRAAPDNRQTIRIKFVNRRNK